mgnify:CR=1 FL=1
MVGPAKMKMTARTTMTRVTLGQNMETSWLLRPIALLIPPRISPKAKITAAAAPTLVMKLSGGRVEDAVKHGVIASDKIAGSGDFYGVAHYWIPFEFGLKEPSCVSRVYQRNRLITIGFRFLTKFLAFSDNTEDAD